MSVPQSLLPNLRLPAEQYGRGMLDYTPHMKHPFQNEIPPYSNLYAKPANHLNAPFLSVPFHSMPAQSLSANPSPRQSPRVQPSLFQSASKNILPGYFFPNVSSPRGHSKTTLTNILEPNVKFAKHHPQNFPSGRDYSGTASFMPSMEIDNENKAKSHKISSIHDNLDPNFGQRGSFIEVPPLWPSSAKANQKPGLEIDYSKHILKNGYSGFHNPSPNQDSKDGFASQRLQRVPKSCDEKNFLETFKNVDRKISQEELPVIRKKPFLMINDMHVRQEEGFQKSPLDMNSCKPKIPSSNFPGPEDFQKPKQFILPAYPQQARPMSKGRKSLFKFASQSQGSIVLHEEEPQMMMMPLEKKNTQQNIAVFQYENEPQKQSKLSYSHHPQNRQQENPLIRSETYRVQSITKDPNDFKMTPSRPETKELLNVKSETKKILEKIRTNMVEKDQQTQGRVVRRLSIEDIKEPSQSKDFRVAQEFTKVTNFSRKAKQPEQDPRRTNFQIQNDDNDLSAILAKRYENALDTEFTEEIVFENSKPQTSVRRNRKLVDLLADLDALDTEPAEPRRYKYRSKK